MKSLLQVFRAVASAMIGVGKKKNLAQDFDATEKTGPWPVSYTHLTLPTILLV